MSERIDCSRHHPAPGFMVRVEGLEPPRLAAPEPKSGASTNFATPAGSSPAVPTVPRSLAKGTDADERQFIWQKVEREHLQTEVPASVNVNEIWPNEYRSISRHFGFERAQHLR